MKKIMALDIGDKWTGIAISDLLKIVATPFKTVETAHLESSLETILKQEPIDTIVIGDPKTLKGTESDQTKKTREFKNKLENTFQTIKFVLWDERLSSKRADQAHPKKKHHTKEEKLMSHARAAAFILDTYLVFLGMQTT